MSVSLLLGERPFELFLLLVRILVISLIKIPANRRVINANVTGIIDSGTQTGRSKNTVVPIWASKLMNLIAANVKRPQMRADKS
jgi:hypothetical protein